MCLAMYPSAHSQHCTHMLHGVCIKLTQQQHTIGPSAQERHCSRSCAGTSNSITNDTVATAVHERKPPQQQISTQDMEPDHDCTQDSPFSKPSNSCVPQFTTTVLTLEIHKSCPVCPAAALSERGAHSAAAHWGPSLLLLLLQPRHEAAAAQTHSCCCCGCLVLFSCARSPVPQNLPCCCWSKERCLGRVGTAARDISCCCRCDLDRALLFASIDAVVTPLLPGP
jgi:hypothetical protein